MAQTLVAEGLVEIKLPDVWDGRVELERILDEHPQVDISFTHLIISEAEVRVPKFGLIKIKNLLVRSLAGVALPSYGEEKTTYWEFTKEEDLPKPDVILEERKGT